MGSNNFHHLPVLLKEVIDNLAIKKGQKYIDATLGGGGHTGEIVKRGGIVLGIDQDKEAVEEVRASLQLPISNSQLVTILGNFGEIERIAKENGFGSVSGILFDLGMSSFQIDASGRGFSFLKDEPLDMRMGDTELTAKEIINTYSQEKLYDIFSKLGEEEFSLPISNNIIERRKVKPIETTGELVSVIEEVVKRRDVRIHPATRVFQALRIAVNSEIDNLKQGLDQSINLLEENGRLLVISFHSGEDRVVKRKFLEFEEKGKGKVINKKPIIASFTEESSNPRSRSAKLRIFEKN